MLQWAYRVGPQETHENLDKQSSISKLRALFGNHFDECRLYTINGDTIARIDARGELIVEIRIPSSRISDVPKRVEESHNRAKNYLIPEDQHCPFLVAIGVMTPEGVVRKAKYAKFRQVNRFLELVNDIVPSLPKSGTLHVVDFGCGKSSLTFAIHHLLANIHGRDVRILGLDRNRDVINSCRETARDLELDGIEFQVGDIASCSVDFPVDLAVSLHACDTATDDALARAIAWNAGAILAVPCCQHEIARKLKSNQLDTIAGYGILKERLAELATDALRAAALEIAGYKTQVVEFIEMEHTPKNLLLRAVRASRDPRHTRRKVESYLRLKQSLGLDRLYLEETLGPAFSNHLARSSATETPERPQV